MVPYLQHMLRILIEFLDVRDAMVLATSTIARTMQTSFGPAGLDKARQAVVVLLNLLC
jgi:chaperonin GroEL (HSP60 family)